MTAPALQEARPLAAVSRLPPLPSGWQGLRYVPLADGCLAVLATDVDLAGEHRRIQAAAQTLLPPHPPARLSELSAIGNARIWSIAAGGSWVPGPSFPLETPFPHFDRFGDGRWLVVATRTRGDPNARVLGPDGALLARRMLGDGVEHVAIDGDHRIWVGWFDEGIFGNENWLLPGHGRPPSNNGIGCFADTGDLVPLPDWPAEAGWVVDCYALAIADGAVWVCPYTDFPLVRFMPGEPCRWWRSEITGPNAIAIDGCHALLAGGYTADANRLALVALDRSGEDRKVSIVSTWALPLRRLPPPQNRWSPVWNRPDLLAGRGDMIHLVDDGVWYRWRVGDLHTA